jgi:hypothetical protein
MRRKVSDGLIKKGSKLSTSILNWVSISCTGVLGGLGNSPSFGVVDPEDFMKLAGHSNAIDLSQPDTLSAFKMCSWMIACSNSMKL